MKSHTQLSIFVLLIPVWLVLLASNGFSADGPQKAELTLATAMTMAIRNNLDLRVDALDSSMAETDIKRNRGIYDPYLSMSVNHGQTFYTGETYGTKDTSTAVGLTQYLSTGGSLTAATQTGHTKPVSDFPDDTWTDWYTSAGITYIQPLLKNFGKQSMELNITLAENAHEDSLEQFRDSVIETVYSVIKAYNRLYTLRQILEARQTSLASARQLLKKLQQQDKSGVQRDVELSNTEYAISQRLKDLVNAERDIKDQEAELRYLIGVKSKTTLMPVEPPSRDEPLETTEQATLLALENHPELKQLRLDLQSSELQEQVAKRKQLPNLSITASTGFRGIEDKFSDSIQQIGDGKGQWWSAGLQFSVPLGNRVAKNDYRRQRLRTQQLKNRLAAAEWNFRDDVEADMRALISARVQRQVAENALKISEQRVERYRASLAGNNSKVQDLLNAENDLVYARNNLTEALEDFSNAVARLWKDTGVLLERKNININIRKPEELTAGTEPLSNPLASPAQLATRNKTIALPPAPVSLVDAEAEVQSAAPIVAAAVDVSSPTQKVAVKSAVAKKKSPQVKTKVIAEKAVYTLKIGEYVSSELEQARKKVLSAGLDPKVTNGAKRSRQVVRLKVGDYQSQQAAKEQLRLLKNVKAAGFILKLGKSRYRLYAGSFFSRNSALKEQKRLLGKVLSLTLEETSVQLPTSLLTAGSFSNREAAQAGALKLEKMGIKAEVRQNS